MQTPSISAHEQRVVDYYDEETALYVHSWNAEHFHFGIFEPGEVASEHHHPRQVPALSAAVVRMVDRIVGPADLQGATAIVDAGCGVGGTVFELARRSSAHVTGINICRHQLGIAERRAEASPLAERVGFRWGDCAERLPLPDASVDVVVNVESACHYSNRGQFVAECARILRPGGMLVAMDWVARDGMTPADYDRVIAPLCDAWAMVSLERPASYRALVRDAGLELLEDEWLGDEVLDNARLFSRGAAQLSTLASLAPLTPARRRLRRQFATLSEAWLAGDFGLYRYAARK